MKTNLQTKGNEMNINDLDWQEHPAGFGGTQAKIFYLNGYGVSIVLDSMFYSNGIDTYEVAILEGTEDDWEITYNTPITDDVLGHLSEIDVMHILKRVKVLPDGR